MASRTTGAGPEPSSPDGLLLSNPLLWRMRLGTGAWIVLAIWLWNLALPGLLEALPWGASANSAGKRLACVLIYVFTMIASVGAWVAWVRRRTEYPVAGVGLNLNCLTIDLGFWLAMAAGTAVPLLCIDSDYARTFRSGWKLLVATGLLWLLGPAMILLFKLLEYLLVGRKPPQWLRRIGRWDLPPRQRWRERMSVAETHLAIRAPWAWLIKPNRLVIVAARMTLVIALAHVIGFHLLVGFKEAGEVSRVAMFVAGLAFMLYRYLHAAIFPAPSWKDVMWFWNLAGAAGATALGYGLFALFEWLGLGRSPMPIVWGGIWGAIWSLAVLPTQMDEGWRLWMACLVVGLIAALAPALGSEAVKLAGAIAWLSVAVLFLLVRWPKPRLLCSRQRHRAQFIARLLVAAVIGLNAYLAATQATLCTTLMLNGLALPLLGFGALESVRLHAVGPKDR